MAANGYPTPLQDLGRSLIAQVKGLTVAQLKDLLRRQGLTVSGVKSELQIRAIASKFSACAPVLSSRIHSLTVPCDRHRKDSECRRSRGPRERSKTTERRRCQWPRLLYLAVSKPHTWLVSLSLILLTGAELRAPSTLQHGWWPRHVPATCSPGPQVPLLALLHNHQTSDTCD